MSDNLCATLPPPVIDTAEKREIRNLSAMAAVAALRPADAFEARLAAGAVACNACAMDCLRLAAQHRDDLAKTLRCRAQAGAMMRQEKRALRVLAKMQAARKAAAVPAPAAGADQGPQQAAPLPEQTRAARDPAPPAPAPQPDVLAQAEEFAIEEPLAATQVRHDRGLTPANTARIDPASIPSDSAVIDALINGTSQVLLTLDDIGGEPAAAD